MGKYIILCGGRIIDPALSRDEIGDIWLKDGKIVPAGKDIPDDAVCLDVAGKWIVPGLIDMHVHLRDPGQEYKEDIESGTRAAAAGGFTAVACMPNTIPVNDCGAVTRYILEKAAMADARVYPVGAVSRGSLGKEMADFGEMKEAGAVAVTDDGHPVTDSQLMRRSLEYATSHGFFLMSHSEENALSRNGCMNEGEVATRMGLKGIPNAAESVMVYRDIAIAELTGGHVHFCHISTEESLDLIRQAKARGVHVSAESAPHYFSLTEEAVRGYNTNAKMNPPLRNEKSRLAVIEALKDGTLDAIATDHAPHAVTEKDVEFDQAANGIIGLETALPLSLELVRAGHISEKRLVELMSVNPANLLGVEGGTLAEGVAADVTVVDPDLEFVFHEEIICSKGKNSPFIGRKLKGKAVMTFMNGRLTAGDKEAFQKGSV